MKKWGLLAAAAVLGALGFEGASHGADKPCVKKLDGLIVMTPSPAQPPPPGLRLRTMVRPADRLWIGSDPPAWVPLQVGEQMLDLLDATPSGGVIATYRERWSSCDARCPDANCAVTVKIFDDKKMETASIALDGYFSQKERLEVQDVRYAEDGAARTIYFNEACQSYSKEANGKCSALVAVDVSTKKVLWRTGSLVSNNYFLVDGQYIVAAYGFTSEPASIRVVRRSDGKVMDVGKLASTNFEMTTKGDVLSVELYHDIGRANFRKVGFEGDAPKLVALPNTPPNPNDKPKPYDPPLIVPTGVPMPKGPDLAGY
jgi:hypothetical protein